MWLSALPTLYLEARNRRIETKSKDKSVAYKIKSFLEKTILHFNFQVQKIKLSYFKLLNKNLPS